MFILLKLQKIFYLWKYIIIHGLFYNVVNFFFFAFNFLQIINLAYFFLFFLIVFLLIFIINKKFLKNFILLVSYIFLIFGIYLYINWYFNYLEIIYVCLEEDSFNLNLDSIILNHQASVDFFNTFLENYFFSVDSVSYGLSALDWEEYFFNNEIYKNNMLFSNHFMLRKYIYFSVWHSSIPFLSTSFFVNHSDIIGELSDLFFYKYSFIDLNFFGYELTYYIYLYIIEKLVVLSDLSIYLQIMVSTYLTLYVEFCIFYKMDFATFMQCFVSNNSILPSFPNWVNFSALTNSKLFVNYETVFSFSKTLLYCSKITSATQIWENFQTKSLDILDYKNSNNCFYWFMGNLMLKQQEEDLILYNFFLNIALIDSKLQQLSFSVKNFFLIFMIITKLFQLSALPIFCDSIHFFYKNFIDAYNLDILVYLNKNEQLLQDFLFYFIFDWYDISEDILIDLSILEYTAAILAEPTLDEIIESVCDDYAIGLLNIITLQEEYLNTFFICIDHKYYLYLDSFSILFFLLTLFLFPICFLLIWNITIEVRFLIIILLFIELLLLLVFCSINLIIFYLSFEAILIPMSILILNWGSRTRKIKAMYYFFLYTLLTSLLMFIAIMLIYFFYGTLNFIELFYIAELKQLTLINKVIWLCFFIALAAKIPMYPFHLWLPEAHVEAPTVGSVILAAILLKVGGFGFVKILLLLLPEATNYFRTFVFWIALISIIYSSLILLRQIDMKKLIAYSSIAHMNVAVLGLFSNTLDGINAGIYFLISHGFSSSALFILVGILYDRFHTRLIYNYSGLVQIMPKFSFFFFFFTLANFGFPGTANFIAEFGILAQLAEKNYIYFFLIFIGILFSVVYSLFLFIKILFGRLNFFFINVDHSILDINKREFWILLNLLFWVIFFGIYGGVIPVFGNYFLLFSLFL